MFWKRFTQARSADKLFNQANENWRRRQRFVLASDDEGARQACIEVIRLCQLSIQGDERVGDAYVLLANALVVAASCISRQMNLDRYKFLHSRAAAVFHFWYTLPHRGYPITKKRATENGERLWRITLDEIKRDEGLSESQAMALMDSYRDSLAADTVSPSSFEEIEKVISNQSLARPFPSTASTAESRPKPEVSEAEILEEICQLEGMFRISIRGAGRLTYAESNIIVRKVKELLRGPFGARVFPVTEEADEEKINEWLNHPLINISLPDTFVMSMAAHTPIPVATMERILRKLLQEDYDTYFKMAEARVRSKKQA